ncbi:MAG: citrate/2-methylcitrate synthase [Planctomycetaceae bacterium]|nr:citrate/2-methylcitrate synthase [Planctomycetaceae bacterium]
MASKTETEAAFVWETSIAAWDPQPLFRGYPVDELASSSTFLETAFLLMTGELPTDEQLADWQALLFDGLTLTSSMRGWLQRVPKPAATIDVLQAALARCRLSDSLAPPQNSRAAADAFPRWLGFVAAVIGCRSRLQHENDPIEPRADLGFAAQVWWLIHGKEPASWIERTLEQLLIVCAEHGFTASTWAVRAAAAAQADLSTSLQAGLAVAQGARSSGSATATLNVLSAVKSPERATAWVAQTVAKNKPIPGFQHRLYRVGDPRTDWLSPRCREAAERMDKMEREELATAIEQAVWDQKKILPAVVWPAARLLDYIGIHHDLFGPLFVLSRMAGWAAHDAEQRRVGTAPVIRAHYIGPAPRPVRPIQEPT